MAGGLVKPDEAFESVETFSPADERFNRRRRTAGLLLGPIAFVAVLLLPMPSLSPAAHRLAAILVFTFFSAVLDLPVLLYIGLVIGALTLRLAGHYFVIATMAFALLISIGAKNLAMTHGELGISNIPKPALLQAFSANQSYGYYYLVLVVGSVIAGVYLLLMRSAFGRRLRAIRDNPLLADADGVLALDARIRVLTPSTWMMLR